MRLGRMLRWEDRVDAPAVCARYDPDVLARIPAEGSTLQASPDTWRLPVWTDGDAYRSQVEDAVAEWCFRVRPPARARMACLDRLSRLAAATPTAPAAWDAAEERMLRFARPGQVLVRYDQILGRVWRSSAVGLYAIMLRSLEACSSTWAPAAATTVALATLALASSIMRLPRALLRGVRLPFPRAPAMSPLIKSKCWDLAGRHICQTRPCMCEANLFLGVAAFQVQLADGGAGPPRSDLLGGHELGRLGYGVGAEGARTGDAPHTSGAALLRAVRLPEAGRLRRSLGRRPSL